MPYWSVSNSGTLFTSKSPNLIPSMVSACALTSPQLPTEPLDEPEAVVPSIKRPVLTAVSPNPLPRSTFAYSRKKTWCEAFDVYVWFWSIHGVVVFVVCGTPLASIVTVARVNAMKFGRSSVVPKMPSAPAPSSLNLAAQSVTILDVAGGGAPTGLTAGFDT